MTVRQRVIETGRTLTLIALGRSLLFGMATGLTLSALLWPVAGGAVTIAIASLAAAGVAWWSYVGIRGPGFTVPAVSLWVEEHVPALGYRLVTAVEDGAPIALERSLSAVDWSGATRHAARSALTVPAIMAAVAASLLAASLFLAPAASRIASRVIAGPGVAGGALDVTVRVTAPPYARRRTESYRNPPVIRALVGSELHVSVAGDDSFALTAGSDTIPYGSPYRITRSVALQVHSNGKSRLLAVDAIPDSAPAVRLRLPSRDTVLMAPEGSFTLGADIRDDLGLSLATFEYIVSSGSGESFTFASGTIGATRFDGAATGAISGHLALTSLDLEPGDFVHVRAVAFDLRRDTALARGTSETRTIRIARAGEYDSVAVEAAAPAEADKAILSQRMLINLAEALVRRRSRITRETYAEEARAIGRDQARLRRQVSDLLFARLGDDPGGEHSSEEGREQQGQERRVTLTPDELLRAAEKATTSAIGEALDFHGDETPVVAVNRPLLEAYNFMWEAGRELDQGSPRTALPAMYLALDAIQRARAAERLYLRSRPPRAVVDVDRARLQGKERGTPAAREPRTSLGPSPAMGVARDALARFARLVGLASRDPAAAADSLLLLRIDLLGSVPADAASAAAAAADALRNGRDASESLAVFRQSLGPSVVRQDSLSRWRGAR